VWGVGARTREVRPWTKSEATKKKSLVVKRGGTRQFPNTSTGGIVGLRGLLSEERGSAAGTRTSSVAFREGKVRTMWGYLIRHAEIQEEKGAAGDMIRVVETRVVFIPAKHFKLCAMP